MSPFSPYRAVLRTPHACGAFVSSLAGRLCYGLAGLSLLLTLLISLAGVLVSPALATAYVLADSLAAPQARNRAGNWVSSGYNAGGSAGSVLAGQLAGRIPLSACLPVLAVPALLAVVPLLCGLRRGAAPDPGRTAVVNGPAHSALARVEDA